MTKRFWGFKRLRTTCNAWDNNRLRHPFLEGRFPSLNGRRTHVGASKSSSVSVRKQ